ncbi:MAG: 16S rRNA (guanine(966)-N(2))-methyltransferase RsmD [Cyanobacteria bacterium P01_G01_bin.4]
MSIRVYGNRPLKTLSGQDTRPTSSRVREAVFNIWRDQVDGCRWLDLCAGVGAMGAEALCRGAQEVVGIERSPAACRVVQQNWQRLAKSDQQRSVVKGDVRRVLQRWGDRDPFDCIYFDPPYASPLYLPTISTVACLRLLAPAGELVAEHGESLQLPDEIEGLQVRDRRSYGHTGLTFYEWRSVN